jgi:hypothetical protein
MSQQETLRKEELGRRKFDQRFCKIRHTVVIEMMKGKYFARQKWQAFFKKGAILQDFSEWKSKDGRMSDVHR